MNRKLAIIFCLISLVIVLSILQIHHPTKVQAAGAQIFVSSTGVGTDCTQSEPCLFTHGLSIASDGDTIYFATGMYTGSTIDPIITITKGVTLIGGWDGDETGEVVIDPDDYETEIDGESARSLIKVDSPSDVHDVSIIGFTLINGHSQFGGAINVTNGRTIIENNSIKNNYASSYGGGIYAAAQDGLVVRKNLFFENSTEYGGGGLHINRLSEPEVALIENNHFLANFTGTTGYGGAIEVSRSAAIINANRIANTTIASSAILVTSNELVQITNNFIYWDSYFSTNPAAINIWYAEGETTHVINNTIVNAKEGVNDTMTANANITNNIFYNCGKSIDLETDSNFTGSNNLFYENDDDPLFLDDPIIDESPRFVDKDNFDYHIKKDSPAVDAGAVVSLSTDFDGENRPSGSGYDIGADEVISDYLNYLPLITR